MAALLQFLRRLFTKPVAPPPPGSIPERYWEADLSSQDSSCFIPELDERYRTQLSGNTLNLELLRPGIFAWTEAQPYRYRDFSLVGRIQLPSGSPADSAGFILRMADAGSFVCVLASARGLRMDVFFNGDPRTIVPWTPCPWISLDDGVVLSIVARDSRYLVFADSRFAFEAEDESTEAGILAFAARNEGKPGSAVLHSLAIESRPVEVEVAFYHLMRLGASDTEQRRRLARSLFSNGDYLTALIHLKKLDEASIARERLLLRSGDTTRGNSEPGSETQDLASNAGRSEERVGDAFLRAECYLRLQMYEDAEKAILACLAMDPEHSEAQEERFNLLYLQGRLKELRDNLAAVPNKVAVNPRLSNLQAHAFFGLGAYREAAEAYGGAARLEPAMPIYAMNEAKAWEKAGELSQAAAAWIQAAHGFFDQSAWDDAVDCASRLKELKYDTAARESLEGRIAYGRGDFEAAERLFARLSKKKSIDAPAAYLYGLILAKKGKRSAATNAFRTAVKLDTAVGLYHFRLAESLIMGGQDRDEAEQALATAISLDPDFAWAHNLAGQLAMADGLYEEAARHFLKTVEFLPEAPEPAINLSAALAALSRFDQALEVVEKLADSHASAANQGANVLASRGRLMEAADWYGKAIALCGEENQKPREQADSGAERDVALAEYRTNLAAVLIEQDRLPEAQDELRRALQTRMDARALYLMGDLAQAFGDLPRAEAAYTSALELAPGSSDVLRRLTAYHLRRRQYQQAKAAAEALYTSDQAAAEKVLAEICLATLDELSCASCDQKWTVPKPLPPVPRTIVRGELPDDSPAGSCAECGAVLCVACGKQHLIDGRFICLKCGGKITLNDDRVRWIVRDFVRKAAESPQA